MICIRLIFFKPIRAIISLEIVIFTHYKVNNFNSCFGQATPLRPEDPKAQIIEVLNSWLRPLNLKARTLKVRLGCRTQRKTLQKKCKSSFQSTKNTSLMRCAFAKIVFTPNNFRDIKLWKWIWARIAAIAHSTTKITWKSLSALPRTLGNPIFQSSPNKATFQKTLMFISIPCTEMSTLREALAR